MSAKKPPKDPAVLILEHELAEARKRVEQQQRTIEALAGSVRRAAGDARTATIGPGPGESERAPAMPAPAAAQPAFGWPAIPLPKTTLPVPPGLAAQSLAGRNARTIAFAVFGLAGAALEGAVKSVAGRQRQTMDFVPVFLTDAADLTPFRRRGYVAEYLPTTVNDGHPATFRLRLLASLRKWRAASLVDAGESGWLESRVSRNEIDAFIADPARSVCPKAEPVKFTVISPVYNVAKYLDDYFKSLTEQSIGFGSRIELILVDDGSTDASPKIIDEWRKKFPSNISYLRKDNGGLASARNFGLPHASGEWVTFIDPDDFLDRRYFEEVDRAIQRHGTERLAMVSCNFILFFERGSKYSDTHPLRHRFANGEKALPATELGEYVQLNVTSAFLRTALVRKHELSFDARIRPGFEDAHFVNRYLVSAGSLLALFIPQAKYFYRKRADRSSLLDASETQREWYDDQLRHGYLDLLKKTRDATAGVPAQVQLAVLYSVHWRFRRAVDKPEAVYFLDDEERATFLSLLNDVFSLIDVPTVMDYAVTDLAFFYKVGMLALFKGTDPTRQIVVASARNERSQLTRFVFSSRRKDSVVRFFLDGEIVLPTYSRVRRRDFLGLPFCWEHIVWVDIENTTMLAASVDSIPTALELNGQLVEGTIDLSCIDRAMQRHGAADKKLPLETLRLTMAARSPEARSKFKDAWVFMDRDTDADDNAEHLYRFVRDKDPSINSFFVIRRSAADWQRLEREGFKLLEYDTTDHASALANARYLISSHADQYVHARLSTVDETPSYRFVFLQHGVIKDDISQWLNGKPIARFITSTPAEFNFVAKEGPFVFSEREVVLTGMPRHDALLRGPPEEKRVIVVMPTWRKSLVGKEAGFGNRRLLEPSFARSEYAQRWKSVLHSRRLLKAASAAGHQLCFVPHKNIEPYLDFFDLPADVTVKVFGDGQPISPFFRQLSLFVTDFTSKAFDVAYLGKPLLYYQFDDERFFGGGHISRPGYFDYERDGFGPVCRDEDALVAAIESHLEGVPPNPIYRSRAEKAFPFRDGKCCERVFEAILALDRPHDSAA